MPVFGSVAEWLGRALQKLVQRFESARDLQWKGYSNVILFYFRIFMIAEETYAIKKVADAKLLAGCFNRSVERYIPGYKTYKINGSGLLQIERKYFS